MTGFLTRAALALEPFSTAPVWPAAAPEAVTVLLPLLSENVRDVPVTQETSRRQPRSGTSARPLRAVRVEGPMSLVGVYDGLEAVWAWALGLQHTSHPIELASGAYQHVYELDPVAHSHAWPFGAFNAGDISVNQQLVRRSTLAIERTVSVWEHLSTMVRSLTFYASASGVTLSLNLLGHSTDRASATNTTAVVGALSEPDWQVVEFHQLECRLAPFSASTALDSGDAIQLSAFRLDVSHHLKTRQRRDTGLFIGEPRRDQLPEVFGSLTLPYYDSDTLVGWARAQTVLMAELRFTGAQVGATGHNYQLCFWLPALQLEALEAGTQGPADRDQSVNFRALVTDTAPSGFPSVGVPGPLYVELVTTETLNPLTGAVGSGVSEGGGEDPDPPEVVTWNPADKAASITLDTGNLRAFTSGTSVHDLVRSTTGKSTGKWYCEAVGTGGFGSGGRSTAIGISRSTAGTGNGHQPNSWMLWDDGDSFHNSSGTDHTAQLEYEPSEVVMIAIDMDAGKIWWGVNGTWKGDPAAGTGAQYSNLSDTCHLTAIPWQTNRQWTARFAAADFSHSPPSGFSAWES